MHGIKAVLFSGLLMAGTFVALSSSEALAESSYSVCGYTFVEADSGDWTVFKDGEEIDTYDDEHTLEDMVEEYCS